MFAMDRNKNKMHVATCRYVDATATDKYGSPRFSFIEDRKAAQSIVTVLNSWTCGTCNSYAEMLPGKGDK